MLIRSALFWSWTGFYFSFLIPRQKHLCRKFCYRCGVVVTLFCFWGNTSCGFCCNKQIRLWLDRIWHLRWVAVSVYYVLLADLSNELCFLWSVVSMWQFLVYPMLDGTWKWWHDKKVVRLEKELRESTFYKHVSPTAFIRVQPFQWKKSVMTISKYIQNSRIKNRFYLIHFIPILCMWALCFH